MNPYYRGYAVEQMNVGGGGAAQSALSAAIQGFSPVLHMPLTEGSGTFLDLSSNAAVGTKDANVTHASVVGGFGQMYPAFAAGEITIPDLAAYSFAADTGPKTFIAMVKPTTPSTTQGIISKWTTTSTNVEWGFALSSSKLFGATYAANGSLRRYNISGGSSLGAGAWSFAAMVVENGQNGPIQLALNSGTYFGSTTNGPGGGPADGAGVVRIGNAPIGGGGGSKWTGSIGQVAMFSAALSAVQLGTLYDAAVADGWFA